jgi:hypothetical protein
MGTGVGTRVTMAFDLFGFFETVREGVSKLPSAVIAALLLGGPTAIWLITRFVNPPQVVKPVEIPVEDRLWLCGSCLSINEDRHDHCYRCQRVRAAESMPVVIHGAREGFPRIGVAVGPGMAESLSSPGWLGGEFIVTQLPTKAQREQKPSAKPAPAARPKPATRQDPAADPPVMAVPLPSDPPDEPPPHVEPPPLVEPRILEPRVKVSTRAAASKSTGRRGRQRQGAGETN